MTVRRLASFALIAAASASAGGCAASRVGNMPAPGMMADRAPLAPSIADSVLRHNRNAELVQSVEATPTVALRSRMSGSTSGKMVFERPHNFRFVVKRNSLSTGPLADLGSNDDEFWFWASDKEDRNVYVARYDAPPNPGGSSLAFQPDWIIEALGLREIPDEEVRQIKTSPGTPGSGNVIWTHTRTTLQGEPIKKITVLDRNGQIVQHQFFMPGLATPVAIASPSGSMNVVLAEQPSRTVRMPEKIKLRILPADPKGAPLEMELALNDVKLNQPIDQARRDDLFSLPQIEGSTITRLNEPDPRAALSPDARQPRTRQSLNTPPAGAGVELGAPSPVGTDGAFFQKRDPMPIEADLAAGAVVGTPVPRPVEPAPLRSANRNDIPYE